ncbi:NmrA-like family protein [Aquisphaera giovannonii]|uniref:NmrA-like family protein n=1 Tax=Aquisphaera giovannonii TaxID=406548 RepID=A0A5B9VYE3_9BACT|nr:NAD(P)H-binding protein [Aquisphaera giovannonii]QEH33328.1 NmrA-like family protein [Aquisphaera giovannonii]
MITITVPTGHVGRHLVEWLASSGRALTVIARRPDRLPRYLHEREIVRRACSEDAAAVARATEGTDVLFWVSPSNPTAPDVRGWYRRLAEVVGKAVRVNRIPRVVNLSSVGAGWADGLGPISGLNEVERAINDAAKDVTHIRAGFFMENFLGQLASLRGEGEIPWLYPGSMTFPMIAARDIAEVAARRLLDARWTGRCVQALHGPADLSLDAAVNTLGVILGRRLRNVQLSADEYRRRALEAGLSQDFADRYVQMCEALGVLGWSRLGEPRTPDTTTSTTLGAWASEVLIPLVRAA